MGNIEIRPYILCYLLSFGLIAIGATFESLVFVGYLGGLVLALVSLMLIVNIVTD